MKTQIGYWFSRIDGTTEYQKVPASIGRTDRVSGAIKPCENGLHSSPTPWDALKYAPGPVLWVVEIGGTVVPNGNPIDKHASSERKYIKRIDITRILRKFAARIALTVIKKCNPPTVVSEWDAAWDAARAAAWAAACDAALDTARAAEYNKKMLDAKTKFNEMVYEELNKS